MPKVKNYTIKKMIKITPDQNRNWNPKQIRELLDGKVINPSSDITIQSNIRQLRENILFLMRFFQRNKANLTISDEERPIFEKIVEEMNKNE